MSFLLNFIVQLIREEILPVDNQELGFLHADHCGPPYCSTQKAHFLVGEQGQRQCEATPSPASASSVLPLTPPPHHYTHYQQTRGKGNLARPLCAVYGIPVSVGQNREYTP